MIKVLELYSGTECISNAFRERGCEAFTIDWGEQFPSSMHCDIGKLELKDLPEEWRSPDVIWMAPECFAKDTLVYTKEGYKEIQDITCDDLVLTHKGNYKPVYEKIKSSKTNCYKIKISGCEAIICSAEHPFLVRRKHRVNTHKNGERIFYSELLEPEWIKADELSTDYKVGIPINNNSIIPKWNGTIYNKCNNYGVYHSYRENTLSQYMDNEDFWWLVGRYFGDGSLSKQTEKRKSRYSIDICCELTEINEIKPIIERLKIKHSERGQNNVYQFDIHSKEWWEFLSQFGFGALNKHITPTILDLPINLLRSFLDGYISADGYWDNSLNNPCCSITTVSRKLAYGLQQCILKAYGRYCSLAVDDNPNNVICGRTVNVHACYRLGFYKNQTNRLQYTIENGMAWVNVRNVEKLPTKQKTLYNLSVEDDESYTVNNISVHNCTTYSLAAISKHRRKNPDNGNLDPISDYAKECDETNQHTLELLKQLKPKVFWIENPRSTLQNMIWMKPYDKYKHLITYCSYMQNEPYELRRMKPTNLWTNIPNPPLKKPCHNGNYDCHPPAPRGSNTYGTQAMKGHKERSTYPKELCEAIVDITIDYLNNKY